MKKFLMILFLSLVFASPGFGADYTTTKGVLMDWTLLDDTAATPYLESDPLVTDTWIGAIIYIDVAHADTNAVATAGVVKIWAKSGTTDEDWHEIQELSIDDDTANAGDIDDACPSANATLYLTSTTNFETSGDVYFVKDVGTLANSCLIINGTFSNDVHVISVDPRVNAYDASDYAYDVVDQWPVRLGPGFTYKVTFHNKDADATFACRIRYRAETAIE